MEQQQSSTHFGYKEVPLEEKAELVQGVFSSVARNYDRMNDVMSFGVHRLWKQHLMAMIKPRAGQAFLDVAGGTGDIAFLLAREAERDAQRCRAANGTRANITVCDITEGMLIEGRKRADQIKSPFPQYQSQFDWVCGTATGLAMPSNTFDCYTISFGLRNVDEPDKGLAEAYRVLKPGGRFFCLEFSHVVLPLLAPVYEAYSFNVIPQMGQLVAGDKDSYQYLVESIRKFPTQPKLESMMVEAGFERVSHTNMSGGIVAIHTGWKI